MFSATVSEPINEKCWCTMPIPSAAAARGLSSRAGAPSIEMLPALDSSSPERIFISVDLPAPFSPQMA